MEIEKIDIDEAYQKSVELLTQCISKFGFYASPSQISNYRRIWSRDGVIIGLASILVEDEKLIGCFRRNLDTLAKFQGRSGQIPSNVDVENKTVSYGGTAGRVDATLWYIIGCSQYYKDTQDREFLRKHIRTIERAINVLESWEFNQKGFIYVPASGDWADEFIISGYALYDQLLYHRTLIEYCHLLSELERDNSYYIKKAKRLKKLIDVNFWLKKENKDSEFVYHNGIFKNGLKTVGGSKNHWVSSFDPFTFYNGFDAFSNILSILFNIAGGRRMDSILDHASKISKSKRHLIPAFYPPITKKDREWNKLRFNYSFSFKNKPNEYHNGGLWPMITGFYVSALTKAGRKKEAKKSLNGVNYANHLGKDKENWGFYEFLNGKTFEPGGTKHLGWSAAGGIIAYQSLKDKSILQ